MIVTAEAIARFEGRKRAAFVNSLPGFKPGTLVGTVNAAGITNAAIFSSVVHIGANPALMGIIFRPLSVPRHTYQNIRETGYFTLNHITEEIYKAAHKTSARFDDGVSEFAECGLTEEYRETLPAPYVLASPVKIGLKYTEEHLISANQTVLLIGEIMEVIFPDSCLAEDGYLDLERAGVITVSGLDSYHSTRRISRLPYAKPDSAL